MQSRRRKRPQSSLPSTDFASTSNSIPPPGSQTDRQLSRRATLSRSNTQTESQFHQSNYASLNDASAFEPNTAHAYFASTNQPSNSCLIDSPVSSAEVNHNNSGLTEYLDLGSCTEICQYCGALFWSAERLLSYPLSQPPRYNKCCKAGRVSLEYPTEPPRLLRALFADVNFLSNIRAYNSMFSMTSFGAVVDEKINQGRGPYVFKIAGQISHWLGSLCPPPGQQPRFLQMYIFDSENELSNRLRFFSSGDHNQLSEDVVTALIRMFEEINEYVHLFKAARELYLQPDVPNFVIKLYSRANQRRYENPARGTLGAIICDGNFGSEEFDIIIRGKDDTPHRVSKLHPSYMPLQYPLLFPRGEQGWSPELQLASDSNSDERNLSPSMYYSFQIHDRHDRYTHLLKAGRLFQQYLVDAYVCIEHCRLQYIRSNQNTFRSEFLGGVHDAISRGDTEGSYLWNSFKVYKLRENIRVLQPGTPSVGHNLQSFSHWLLNVGDGKLGTPLHGHPDVKVIEIPPQFLIQDPVNGLNELIHFIYDESVLQNPTTDNIANRAIICPKNETVDEINKLVHAIVPGECVSYYSTDSMVPRYQTSGVTDEMYPLEYLNTLNFYGIPHHCLKLKKKQSNYVVT